MKILLICNKSPYPATEGGPMAMDATIRGLVDVGQEVTVLTVSSHKFMASPKHIPADLQGRIEFLSAPVDLRIKPLPALRCLLTRSSYHARRFYSPALANSLSQLLQTKQFDIIQLESVFMGVYVPLIRSLCQSPILLRAHNVEHMIWDRIAMNVRNPVKRWYINRLSRDLERFEKEIVMACDAIAAISPEDAAWFSLFTDKPLITLPYSVDTAQWLPKPGLPSAASVFYLGAMSWWPNEEGIKWFLREVWPLILSRDESVVLHLAGRSMPSWLRSDLVLRLMVHEEVEDAKRFISQHSIMIIPLKSGSGMRIKMVEGMLAGRAIVSTTVGAEGIPLIPNVQAFIADEAHDFAEAVLQLIAKPELRESMSLQAHNFALVAFDRKIQNLKLLDLYHRLISEASASNDNN